MNDSTGPKQGADMSFYGKSADETSVQTHLDAIESFIISSAKRRADLETQLDKMTRERDDWKQKCEVVVESILKE